MTEMASDEAIVAFVQSSDDPAMTRKAARENYLRAKWARERAEAKLAKMTEAKTRRDDIRAQTRTLRERQESERKARLAWDTSRA